LKSQMANLSDPFHHMISTCLNHWTPPIDMRSVVKLHPIMLSKREQPLPHLGLSPLLLGIIKVISWSQRNQIKIIKGRIGVLWWYLKTAHSRICQVQVLQRCWELSFLPSLSLS
jgi:hypothetical protein